MCAHTSSQYSRTSLKADPRSGGCTSPASPTGTIPASNRPIEVPACQVVQVEGGKVKSVSHYFDMLTLLTQIGATQSAAPHQSAA